MAARLRDRIHEATGLDASFGVATSKTVAKIASDLRKPRGFVVVAPGEELEFLRPLPLRTLPGLGPATAATLSGLGLRTLGDLASHPPALLERRLGRAAALSLTRRAQGIVTSPVTPPSAPKSISREETYDHDVIDPAQLRERVRHLSAERRAEAASAGLSARTVSLTPRGADFTTVTRSARSTEGATATGRSRPRRSRSSPPPVSPASRSACWGLVSTTWRTPPSSISSPRGSATGSAGSTRPWIRCGAGSAPTRCAGARRGPSSATSTGATEDLREP